MNKLLIHSLRYLCFYGFWGFVFTKTIFFPQTSVYFAFGILLLLFVLTTLRTYKRSKSSGSVIVLWMPYLLLTVLSFFMIFKLESFSYWLVCILMLTIATKTDFCNNIPIKFIFWCGIISIVGIWVQMMLPEFYNAYVRPVFTGGGSTIQLWMESGYGYNGFTYQLANTANNIICAEAFTFYFFNDLFPKQKGKRLVYWTVVTIFILSVLLTGKRTYALIAVFVPIIVYFVEKRLSAGSLLLLLIGGGLLIIGVEYFINNVSLFENSKYLHRFSETVELSQSGGDITSKRQDLAEEAIQLFEENPLLGIGVNEFNKRSVDNTDVHNSYLQVLCEQGIVGFIFFIIPLFYCLTRTISFLKKNYYSCTQINYLKVSLFLQLYFIIYALTGNVIIDFGCFSMYFLAVSIFVNVQLYDTYYRKRIIKYS